MLPTNDQMPLEWHSKLHARKWQLEALQTWKGAFRGVVSVVTGGGKTAFAQMCMLEFKQSVTNPRFIVVVPTTALMDQWYISLLEDLAIPESEISCFSAEEKHTAFNVVNIVVLNTARDLAPTASIDADTMLVVDECHRAGSPVNALALRGEYTATLGLSATPKREYDDGFEYYVVPVLGEVIYEYTYIEAARDGVISPFELVNIQIDLLEHEQAEYDKLSKMAARLIHGDERIGNDERLRHILRRRATISALASLRIPVAAKLVDDHKGQRSILFHERIDKADTLVNILKQRGHAVTVYHTGISPVLRRDNLRLFRRGIFDVLVTCKALDEGMNVPETEVAIIASSTASTRQRIQRLGRVLRPAKGKTTALIYTIFATNPERSRLVAEECELGETVSVVWKRSIVGGYGKDPSAG